MLCLSVLCIVKESLCIHDRIRRQVINTDLSVTAEGLTIHQLVILFFIRIRLRCAVLIFRLPVKLDHRTANNTGDIPDL